MMLDGELAVLCKYTINRKLGNFGEPHLLDNSFTYCLHLHPFTKHLFLNKSSIRYLRDISCTYSLPLHPFLINGFYTNPVSDISVTSHSHIPCTHSQAPVSEQVQHQTLVISFESFHIQDPLEVCSVGIGQ